MQRESRLTVPNVSRETIKPDTIEIHERGEVKQIPKRDEVDEAIEGWVRSLYDGGALNLDKVSGSGEKVPGRLKTAAPFKTGTKATEFHKTMHGRLMTMGLIESDRGTGYIYLGPHTLDEALGMIA